MRTTLPLILATALAVAGCSDAPAPVVLRVSIDLWPGYYPGIIARERGMLDEANVDLQISVPGNTDRMMADFAAGRYDAICVALGDAVDLAAMQHGIKLILMSDESSGGDALLGARPFPADGLPPGARIGTNIGGFGEVFVDEFLKRHGIRPRDVELVNIDAAQVPAMLQRGELDAAHTWEPYVTQALEQGAERWFDSADTPGLIPDGMVVREEVLRAHPEAVRALVHAWFEAAAWWKAEPEAGNALVAAALGVPLRDVSLRGLELLDAAENRRRMADRGPTGLPAVVQRYTDFFLERGVIARAVSPDALIDASFLPAE